MESTRKAEQREDEILSSVLRAQVLMLRLVKSCSAKEGLTVQQFGVLRFLWKGEPMTMNALSDLLKVSPPVVTGIVDRVEAKKLIKRNPSSADRRRTEIVLTEKGKRAYQNISEEYRKLVLDSLKYSLSREEQETLAGLLVKFSREIRFD